MQVSKKLGFDDDSILSKNLTKDEIEAALTNSRWRTDPDRVKGKTDFSVGVIETDTGGTTSIDYVFSRNGESYDDAYNRLVKIGYRTKGTWKVDESCSVIMLHKYSTGSVSKSYQMPDKDTLVEKGDKPATYKRASR